MKSTPLLVFHFPARRQCRIRSISSVVFSLWALPTFLPRLPVSHLQFPVPRPQYCYCRLHQPHKSPSRPPLSAIGIRKTFWVPLRLSPSAFCIVHSSFHSHPVSSVVWGLFPRLAPKSIPSLNCQRPLENHHWFLAMIGFFSSPFFFSDGEPDSNCAVLRHLLCSFQPCIPCSFFLLASFATPRPKFTQISIIKRCT